MRGLLKFNKGIKPFITLPINGSIRVSLSAVGCLPSHTLIRKIYKIYLYVYILLYHFIIKYFVKEKLIDFDENLVSWYSYFTQKNKSLTLYPVVIWSLVEGRKRFYVHLLNNDGDKLFFTKIVTEKKDFELLKNEKVRLEQYSQAISFSVPQVIDFIQNERFCVLTTSYLDSNVSLYHPENHPLPTQILEEINQSLIEINVSKVQEFDWYYVGKQNIEVLDMFKSYVKNIIPKEQVFLSTIHGDFGSENIFIDEMQKIYIIDWERSIDNGPYLTDKVGYWLGANHKKIKENAHESYSVFVKIFEEYRKIDVAMALLYLIGVNFDLAIKLAKYWEREE